MHFLPRPRRALAAFATLLALAFGAQAARAEPALWKVQGAHATVWLFGSIHALKSSDAWNSPRIEAALKASDALYLEIDNADDPAALQPLMLKYGLDPAHPLSTKLDVKERAALNTALASLGMNEPTLEIMRPWMAGLTLSVIPLIKAGYDPQASVEHALTAAARAQGKAVRGFETAEEQVRYLADLPPAEEVAFLDSSVDDAAKGTSDIDALVAAWEAGDTGKIAALMNKNMKAKYPDLYRRLLVERNQRFAKQVAELANGTGVYFVAVGAGHLAGPDSVQSMLAPFRLTAERQ
ncbi:MAG TPA: TraB/GumN family protein [Caulobacteraceae bacterium]|jgi:hypothetical protein|nr:TraB/GumN family protein [Caulobacteraceae bacterium]